MLTALFAGYDALLTDMDISIIHNPLLYMPLNHTWEFQLEPYEFNSGWYYTQSSAAAIRMQHEVLDIYDGLVNLDDQQAYNRWVRAYRHLRDAELKQRLFPLSRQLFPNGQGDHYGLPEGVIQHNNWMLGEGKRARQREKGFYLYNSTLTDLKVAEFLATQPDTPTMQSHSPLLVCNECVVCQSMTPSALPLRDHFPGPLKTSNFTLYAGDAPL